MSEGEKNIAVVAGRAWRFGDNVDTDQISPGKVLSLPLEEQLPHALASLRPEFPKQVAAGDVLVAGKNFGCGSSREHSPEVLKALGVGCVVAESFGRIFYRNALAIGLPVLVAPGAGAAIADGDRVEVDVEAALIRDLESGKEISARPLPSQLLELLHAGGIINKLKLELNGQ